MKLPPKIKAHGRPKGSTQTVIGLSRKCANKNANCRKPMKFWCKRPQDKDRGTCINECLLSSIFIWQFSDMLSWFVGRHAAESALTGRILTERDVKINPTSVSTACLDENISMHFIKHYFSPEGWKTLLDTWEKVVSLG